MGMRSKGIRRWTQEVLCVWLPSAHSVSEGLMKMEAQVVEERTGRFPGGLSILH